MRLYGGLFPFLVVALLLASCATSPKMSQAVDGGAPDFSVLPLGADIYLCADIALAKPLLDVLTFEGMSGRDAQPILERTDAAAAAFFSGNPSRRFFLAGWGDYPNLKAGFSMSFSRDWKRVKSDTGNRYWYSRSNKVGIALGPSLAYASDGDPFAPGAGMDISPPGFLDFRLPCVLSGWIVEPNEQINRLMDNMGIPLQIPAEDFFFGIIRAPDDGAFPGRELWALNFKIRTPSANQARSLVSLFSLARLFMPRGEIPLDAETMSPQEAATLLFANAPVQDGAFLSIRTGVLDSRGIALLFDLFSVYSD